MENGRVTFEVKCHPSIVPKKFTGESAAVAYAEHLVAHRRVTEIKVIRTEVIFHWTAD